jgi:hypothetical protein
MMKTNSNKRSDTWAISSGISKFRAMSSISNQVLAISSNENCREREHAEDVDTPSFELVGAISGPPSSEPGSVARHEWTEAASVLSGPGRRRSTGGGRMRSGRRPKRRCSMGAGVASALSRSCSDSSKNAFSPESPASSGSACEESSIYQTRDIYEEAQTQDQFKSKSEAFQLAKRTLGAFPDTSKPKSPPPVLQALKFADTASISFPSILQSYNVILEPRKSGSMEGVISLRVPDATVLEDSEPEFASTSRDLGSTTESPVDYRSEEEPSEAGEWNDSGRTSSESLSVSSTETGQVQGMVSGDAGKLDDVDISDSSDLIDSAPVTPCQSHTPLFSLMHNDFSSNTTPLVPVPGYPWHFETITQALQRGHYTMGSWENLWGQAVSYLDQWQVPTHRPGQCGMQLQPWQSQSQIAVGNHWVWQLPNYGSAKGSYCAQPQAEASFAMNTFHEPGTTTHSLSTTPTYQFGTIDSF